MGNIIKDISKERFLKIVDKHQPNAVVKWWYRWFNQGKHWRDRTRVWWIVISMAMSGFIVINIPGIEKIGVLMFVPLMLFILMGFYAATSNNFRINRIRKELDISSFEYNMLSSTHL